MNDNIAPGDKGVIYYRDGSSETATVIERLGRLRAVLCADGKMRAVGEDGTTLLGGYRFVKDDIENK
jgi:hypothetical protein